MATTAIRTDPAQTNPLSRESIEAAVETLVALLDLVDGDPDVEGNGDELDGSGASEDEFIDHYGYGPGCPVSDPGGGAIDDEPEGRGDDCASVDFRPVVDPEAYREQIDRIHRERCIPIDTWRMPQLLGGLLHDRRRAIRYRLFFEPFVPALRSIFRRKRGVPRNPRA